jgi:tetratricopeptide (TPR) repeat protein
VSGLGCFGGNYVLGAAYGRESITAFESLQDFHGLVMAYRTAGECQYAVGDLEAAEALFRQAMQLSQERGDRQLLGDSANMLGQLLNHTGAHEEARQVLCEAVGHQLTTGSLIAIAATVHSLTEALRDLGDLGSAELLLHSVVRMAADVGDNRELATGLEGLAGVTSRQGDHDQALRRLGVARAIRERIGAALAPVVEATLRRAMTATFTTTTGAEQLATFAAARAVEPHQIVSELLADAIPVVASGSHDDIAAWIARVVAAQGNVLDA